MLSKYFVVNGMSTLEAVRKGSSDILTMIVYSRRAWKSAEGVMAGNPSSERPEKLRLLCDVRDVKLSVILYICLWCCAQNM